MVRWVRCGQVRVGAWALAGHGTLSVSQFSLAVLAAQRARKRCGPPWRWAAPAAATHLTGRHHRALAVARRRRLPARFHRIERTGELRRLAYRLHCSVFLACVGQIRQRGHDCAKGGEFGRVQPIHECVWESTWAARPERSPGVPGMLESRPLTDHCFDLRGFWSSFVRQLVTWRCDGARGGA
jgi:hypothetical protein